MASIIPPLDTAALLWKFTTVQRLIRITSLLLLAIWLPATLHCDLEAAGFAEAHHSSSTAENDCKADLCATIETSLIKESIPALNLAAPATCDCWLCLAAIFSPASAADSSPALSVVRHVPPREITAGWQFLTRAAPPARAPALNT